MNDDVTEFARRYPALSDRNEADGTGIGYSGTPASILEVIDEGNAPASVIQVSIVVPTCGRPPLLKQCLSSLLRQDFDPASYEIIIVDDGPHAASRAAVAQCVAELPTPAPRVSYIPSPGPHGPASARNYGWRAARAPTIAFTDDDTIASPAWLKNGLGAFGPDVKAVWGRIIMPLEGVPTDYERDAKGLETAEFVTANCFCPKRVLHEIGGFDERFQFAWREDADLYFRLLGLGGRVVHAPEALITHPIRPAPWGVSMKQQKKIQSDALLYKKHPALYRQKIRARPRWDYYLVVACLLAFFIAVPAEKTAFAFAAAAIWLLLTLRFFFMRLKGTVKTPSHIAEMLVTSAAIPPLAVFWRMVGAIKFRVALI